MEAHFNFSIFLGAVLYWIKDSVFLKKAFLIELLLYLKSIYLSVM